MVSFSLVEPQACGLYAGTVPFANLVSFQHLLFLFQQYLHDDLLPAMSEPTQRRPVCRAESTSAELVVAALTASRESPDRVHMGLRSHLA